MGMVMKEGEKGCKDDEDDEGNRTHTTREQPGENETATEGANIQPISWVVRARGEDDAVVPDEDDRPALHVVRLGRETAQHLRAPYLDVRRWI